MVIKKSNPAMAVTPEKCDLLAEDEELVRERFWRTVARIKERNADKDPDEILRDVTEVVEEVRQEQYERERRAQDGN